jgi:hypothetical protein
MSSEAWEKRLCNLIKKYKPSCDVASFRNDYSEVLVQASGKNKITKADVALLQKARDFVEAWANSTPPDPRTAFNQWQELFHVGKNVVPGSVLECILRRFPQGAAGAVDWEPFLLSCLDSCLIDVLLDRRLVREQDLNRLAHLKPTEFYQSVALDVMVQRAALQDPRPLWDECVRGNPRASGLLAREQVLVHCYAICPGDKENEQMLTFLLDSSQDREKILGLLLGEREPAIRFCRYLVFGHPTIGMRAQEWVANGIQDILHIWVSGCESQLEKGTGAETETASLVLGLIRLSLFTLKGEADEAGKLSEEIARTTRKTLLQVLKKGEQDRSSNAPDSALVLLGQELYGAIQEYLRNLHVGTDTGQESQERALRFERFHGSKQVIEQVLLAMGEPLDESGLRDALEVALFNCGVRPLENVGAEVAFDVHLHEAETSGVFPDDPVVVTHSGRCVGDRNDGLVLIKAKVRPISGPDSA